MDVCVSVCVCVSVSAHACAQARCMHANNKHTSTQVLPKGQSHCLCAWLNLCAPVSRYEWAPCAYLCASVYGVRVF